jgi:hypothetical protein
VEYFEIEKKDAFKCVRLVNEAARWDGKRLLHVDGFELFGEYRRDK